MACLASEHNVAELQAIRALAPGRVWVIASPRSREAAARLAVLASEALPESSIEVLGTAGVGDDHHAGDDYAQSADWASRELAPRLAEARQEGCRVALNFTGGTKAATLAIQRCFDWDELHYKAFAARREGIQVLDAAGTVAWRDLEAIDPLSHARLYNERLRVTPAPISGTGAETVARVIHVMYPDSSSPYRRIAELLGALHPEMAKNAGSRNNAVSNAGGRVDGEWAFVPLSALRDPTGAFFDAVLALDPRGPWTRRGDTLAFPVAPKKAPALHRWLAGAWYETLVAAWAEELTGVRPLANLSFQATADDTGHEGDVLIPWKGRLFLVEVKVGPQPFLDLMDLARKVLETARDLGKPRAALVTTLDFGEGRRAQQVAAFRSHNAARDLAWIQSKEALAEWLDVAPLPVSSSPLAQVLAPSIPSSATQAAPEQAPTEAPPTVLSEGLEEPLAVDESDPATAPRQAAAAPKESERAPNEVQSAQPEPQSLIARAPVVVRRPPTRGELLNDIQVRASWEHAQEGLTAAIAAFLREHPGQESEVERRVATGRKQRAVLAEFKKLVGAATLEQATREAEELKRRFPGLRGQIDKQIAFAQNQRARGAERAQTRVDARRLGAPARLSAVVARGEHRIPLLPPAERWELYIDETGNRFEDDAASGLQGRLVGILLGDGVTLPPIDPKFHASNASFQQCDKAFQAVLDAPVGVFGVGFEDLPATPGHRWVDGVLEVVHWVARLLPLPATGPVALDVFVEERGVHSAGEIWSVPVRGLLRELAERDPVRAARLKPHIQVVKKGVSPGLGYVDAIANTWGSPTAEARARRTQSGLLGSCLIEGDGRALRRDWDQFGAGRWPSGDAWRMLLARADARDPHAVGGLLLDRLAAACREDRPLWERYLDAARDHMDSKAINLHALGMETDWLAAALPGAPLPGGLRLSLLAGQLARANHEGEVELPDVEMELDACSAGLVDEAAPLVCLADLHRAVLATNRLDFAAARAALSRWEGVAPAIPGLQMWGRVQSSLGQHDAFEGDPAAALERFRRADEAFARLSDPALAAAERRHTATYAAIATIDLPGAGIDTVRAAVEHVTGPLADAISRLSASGADADKYPHHLLLRYLTHRGADAERAMYVARRQEWGHGEGHPWPLIELYRALLIWKRDRAGAEELLYAAFVEASRGGPTVRLIGATIGAVGVALGMPWENSEEILAPLRAALPRAADRIGRIEQALREKGDPLVLLRGVLPFNFR